MCAQTMESGYTSTLKLKLEPTDTTMEVATAPTVTKGRLFLKSWTSKEWISYTWVSSTTLTWLTRWLSQTADPSTAGTWLTWLSGTKVTLVQMHDQRSDKQEWLPTRVYATTTTRDAAITSPSNGMQCYITADWVFTDYIAWAWAQRVTWATPNGSTTVAGKFEEATVAEQGTASATWATGARLVMANANLVKASSWAGDENKLAILNSSGQFADWFININPAYQIFYGDGNDWATVISSNTTLTEDLYATTLVIDSTKILDTGWYRIYATTSITNNWTIVNSWSAWWAWAAAWWAAGTGWVAWSWITVPLNANGEVGWVWWQGTNANWSAWTAGTAKSHCLNTNNSTAGWAWWAGESGSTWWAWWAAWVSTDRVHPIVTPLTAYNMIDFWGTTIAPYVVCATAGWGWWGGSGDWANEKWWSGWWGWWCGWIVRLCSPIIDNTSWTINSLWWVWWAWWAAFASGDTGWWWGWPWGNGWVIVAIGETITIWTTVVTGGAGWAWWAKNAWWIAGTAWTAGNAWVVIQVSID